MSDGLSLTYNADLAAFRRDMNALGNNLFPRAMATHMNNAAFIVKRKMDAYTMRAIDRPNRFTQKAWSVVKAKPEDGDKMKAQILANPKQSQYLWFLVNGGRRRPGDAGTNTSGRDMFAWTKQENPETGGIDRKFRKKISKELAAEKKKRAKYRAQRQATVALHLPSAQQAKKLAKLRWNVVSKNQPGVFFGTIHGIKGYWRRSERYTRKERHDIITAARSRLTRPNTPTGASSLTWTRSGSNAQLLVAVERVTKYRESFDFYGEVRKAYAAEMTPAKFAASLEYERRRAAARAAAGAGGGP